MQSLVNEFGVTTLALIAGAAYGTLAGVSIGSGQILIPFLLGYGLTKEAFVATIALSRSRPISCGFRYSAPRIS